MTSKLIEKYGKTTIYKTTQKLINASEVNNKKHEEDMIRIERKNHKASTEVG